MIGFSTLGTRRPRRDLPQCPPGCAGCRRDHGQWWHHARASTALPSRLRTRG